MRTNVFLRAIYTFQCRFRVSNRPVYVFSSNLKAYQAFPFYHRFNVNTLTLVQKVMVRLSYSTNTNAGSKKDEELLEKDKPQSKKKKEIKVFITLLGSDGNIISVTTVEEAKKIALRRNMRLIKEQDLDPKSGRAVYKLITESEYLKDDTAWKQSKATKEKEKFIKGNKVVSLTSSTAEHDVLIKTKLMQKWLDKRFEVRVVIAGDPRIGENVFQIIEKEIGTNGRIVQKRNKVQDIRFQILPPKEKKPTTKTEDSKTTIEEV